MTEAVDRGSHLCEPTFDHRPSPSAETDSSCPNWRELAGWFAAAMQIPDVKAKLVAQSLYPARMCGADFAALLSKQYNEFGGVIREANIKAD